MLTLVDIRHLQCLFKYTSPCWELFLIGQIVFYLGGLGDNWNVSGKLGMKLAKQETKMWYFVSVDQDEML